MANINPVREDQQYDAVRLLWTPVTENDAPVSKSVVGQKGINGSIQVNGTFGGMTMALHGSNNDINYFVLKDLQGNDLSFTAAGLKDFTTACAFLKPVRTGGTSASLTVTVIMR